MKIRILGGGWYGCSLALGLIKSGHEVELHEISDSLFSGASGGNPARLHLGFHYPRSGLTQAACQEHYAEFMKQYGHLTSGVPVNLYAIAKYDSLVDYRSYCETLRGKVEFVQVDPDEHGLQNVEGALLTGERHIIIRKARLWFGHELSGHVKLKTPPGAADDKSFDWTIDCTFCANDSENIDRFEPCVTVILKGETGKAVTIMDGPFGSVYPWDEEEGLCSLTSARHTPISKTCRTWVEAKALLDQQTKVDLVLRGEKMLAQMGYYWPEAHEAFTPVDYKLTVRAMPKSAADSRLVDVIKIGEKALRVRAGKIDAVFHAERMIKETIGDTNWLDKGMKLFSRQFPNRLAVARVL